MVGRWFGGEFRMAPMVTHPNQADTLVTQLTPPPSMVLCYRKCFPGIQTNWAIRMVDISGINHCFKPLSGNQDQSTAGFFIHSPTTGSSNHWLAYVANLFETRCLGICGIWCHVYCLVNPGCISTSMTTGKSNE